MRSITLGLLLVLCGAWRGWAQANPVRALARLGDASRAEALLDDCRGKLSDQQRENRRVALMRSGAEVALAADRADEAVSLLRTARDATTGPFEDRNLAWVLAEASPCHASSVGRVARRARGPREGGGVLQPVRGSLGGGGCWAATDRYRRPWEDCEVGWGGAVKQSPPSLWSVQAEDLCSIRFIKTKRPD